MHLPLKLCIPPSPYDLSHTSTFLEDDFEEAVQIPHDTSRVTVHHLLKEQTFS